MMPAKHQEIGAGAIFNYSRPVVGWQRFGLHHSKRMMNASKTALHLANASRHLFATWSSLETEPPENALPVARTHTGSIALSELEHQRDELELALEDLQAQRESLTRWTYLLTLHCNEAWNFDNLQQAQILTRDESSVFAVQGWLPEKHLQRYQAFAEQQGLALLIEEPTEEDRPSILPGTHASAARVVNFINPNAAVDYRRWCSFLFRCFSR